MEPVYLKLFVPICIMFICYCQYKLEYEHSDKRTKENKRRRWGLIGGNIFLAVISGVIIYSDDQGSKTLNSDLAEIKDSNDSLRTLVTGTELQAHNERMKLQEEITKLDSSLEPFRTIAVRRFGSLSESEALSQLAGDVKRLEETVQNAARGITSNYRLNGISRKTNGGRITVDNSLISSFKQIVTLEKKKDFIALEDICNKLIKEHPEWPTPYAFLGEQNNNLNKIGK